MGIVILSPTPPTPPRGREKNVTKMNFSSCNDHSPKWIINDCYIFFPYLRVWVFLFLRTSFFTTQHVGFILQIKWWTGRFLTKISSFLTFLTFTRGIVLDQNYISASLTKFSLLQASSQRKLSLVNIINKINNFNSFSVDSVNN